MYNPENLSFTEIDRPHGWVAGVFSENPSQVSPLLLKSCVDDAPTESGSRDHHNSRIWADVGQLLTTA